MGISKRYGRPGRIPGSINIPFHEFIEKKTGKLKSPKQLLKIIIKKYQLRSSNYQLLWRWNCSHFGCFCFNAVRL